jgi:outer membrane protein assembly factor BamB
MKLNRARSLVIVGVLAIPLAAGGMYALSRRDCHKNQTPATSEQSTECADCCRMPTRGQLLVALAEKATNSDSPLFGGTPQRNMANLVDSDVPTDWSVEEGKEKGIKWTATLGNKAYGGPVVAGGKVFVGTNDTGAPGKAIVMAFDEKDGRFLWKIVHDFPPDELFKEANGMGLCSTPCVDGGKLYYVTPGCEVVCATIDGKIAWKYDMMKEMKVTPFHLANCSPLVADGLVFVVSGNGVGEEGKVEHPKAASFVAFDKDTGKVKWSSDLPGENVFEGQWSNPVYADLGGKKQVIFPGGDGVLYSFEPATGKLLWKFDCLPNRPKGDEKITQNYFISTPIVVGDRLYVGMGVYPEHPQPTKSSYVYCLDITKSGDVSPKSLDAKDPSNKASALVWTFGGPIEPRPKTGRPVLFGRTISTCAVHDGLVYISEESGYLHCLDAKTGQRYWFEDLKAGVWGSPYYVDGKVYICAEDGSVYIFAAGKEKKQINSVDLNVPALHTTPVVANGVLYILTGAKLFAIADKR